MASDNEDRLHVLVNNAEHESVTVDRLSEKKRGAGRPRLNDRPPISYLRASEQPHYVFESRHTPVVHGIPTELNRSRRYRVVHLITDERWLIISGNRSGDDRHTISLEEITSINYNANDSRIPDRLSSNLIAIETGEEYYHIPLNRSISTEDIEDFVGFIEREADATVGGVELDPDAAGYTVQGVDSYNPDEETVAQLLDEVPNDPEAQKEADTVVEEAETGTELVTELNEIIETYGEAENEEILDERVARAESVEELRQDVESSQEKALREAHERITEAKTILRDADPEEVSEWGLQNTQAMLPMIHASRFATPKLLVLSFIANSAVGAYASSKENTVLDNIEPKKLREHALAMAGAGEDLEEIDGEAVGALLGGSSYLIQSMAPEEYAQWVVQADPQAILEGAEMGAQMSQGMGEEESSQGTVAGAALGLLHSYTVEDDDHAAIRETLDSDLYKQYLEELAENDIELPD